MKKSRSGKQGNPQSNALSRKLSEYLEGAFEAVQLTRREHFKRNPKKRPNPGNIDSIITSYANQNFLVAGAANLVPGPWGALAIVPEITLVIRNQIQMIYDIGVAHGKDAHLSSNTLLGIFSTVMGGGAISITTIRGGQLMVKRASLRVLQQIIKWLGGKITRRILRSLVARWVPVVGAGVMAMWARQSTIAMGEQASKLLARDIVEEE